MARKGVLILVLFVTLMALSVAAAFAAGIPQNIQAMLAPPAQPAIQTMASSSTGDAYNGKGDGGEFYGDYSSGHCHHDSASGSSDVAY